MQATAGDPIIMPIQTTLILFKTDCVRKKLCGEVLKRFTVRGIKMLNLSEDILKEHYSHVAHLPFFPEIVEFMQAAPVVALALEGEDVISRVRDLLGPTDSTKAEKGTIRGDFGENMMVNVCHVSDSEENAAVELKRFFGDGELFSY